MKSMTKIVINNIIVVVMDAIVVEINIWHFAGDPVKSPQQPLGTPRLHLRTTVLNNETIYIPEIYMYLKVM